MNPEALRKELNIPEAAWHCPMEAIPESWNPKPIHLPSRKAAGGTPYGGSRLCGAPLGGMGAGGVGRDVCGNFRQWTIDPGVVAQYVEPINGFAVRIQRDKAVKAALLQKPRSEEISFHPWKDFFTEDSFEGVYFALYPRAWYIYEIEGVRLVCEQFSPLIPHNYRESSYPMGIFHWTVYNLDKGDCSVSLMHTQMNMNGAFESGSRTGPQEIHSCRFNHAVEKGIIFDHKRVRDIPLSNRGQMGIALWGENIALTKKTTFQINTQGESLWREFTQSGKLSDSENNWQSACEFPSDPDSSDIAGALCAEFSLKSGSTQSLKGCLVWDFPVVRFGDGREHLRRHTKFFGEKGSSAAALIEEAVQKSNLWHRQVAEWQENICLKHPAVLASRLLNELYLLTDGATVWTEKSLQPWQEDTALFAILECPDYPYYNTLDLWVYASFSIVQLWPELEKQVMRFYARAGFAEDKVLHKHMKSPACFVRNTRFMLPHDIGSPLEDPGASVNAYNLQNTGLWKDLNCQYIMTIYRDYLSFKDGAFLEDCLPAAYQAHEMLKKQFANAEGMIENGGFPDQTYDQIPMKGVSAYCGGLWIGASLALEQCALIMGDPKKARDFAQTAESSARDFVNKLWNGSYFRVDSESPWKEACFIEQVFGLWYAELLGLKHSVPREYIIQALKHICQANWLDYNPEFAVKNITGLSQKDHNEIAKTGDAETQSYEALVGINYSFISQLRWYGLHTESKQLLENIHHILTGPARLQFRTPAALDKNRFRAPFNLRPLMIWSLNVASKGI